MGKYALLLTMSIVGAVTILAYSGNRTALNTSERQSLRQGRVLARQVARSGYNAVLSEAQLADSPDKTVSEVVSAVDTLRGTYEGGTYEAWLEKISPTAYKGVSIGRFTVSDRVVKHTLGNGFDGNKMVKAPKVETPSKLDVTFEQSMAGYCSAVYLERVLPDTEPENQPAPEMIFPPGHDRNDSTSTYDKVIDAGTRLNFILAVDKDCSEENDTSVDYPEDFDHAHKSFEQYVSDLNTMRESPHGMVEEATFGGREGWRVSFEDQDIFSQPKLWDVKKNGYPDAHNPDDSDWHKKKETYGGTGWDRNDDNLRELEDYGAIPDFSDQVIQVSVTEP